MSDTSSEAGGVAERAEARLLEALEETGARDPRELYREQLRELRELDAAGYDEAVRWYRERLIPSIASGEADPLTAWTEYGQRLAELRAAGRTVGIDPSGRSRAWESPTAPDDLVLHLPEAPRERAILVALPASPSAAQRATFRWLVAGKNQLPDPGAG